MTPDMLPRFLYLALLLMAVGGAVIAQARHRPGHSLQQAGIWVLIFLGAIAAFGLWGDIRNQVAPMQSSFENGQRIEVPLGTDGHFHLVLQVNGTPVDFMVDTGASDLVLSRRDAARAGIDPASLIFAGQAATANGPVATARIRLATVSLGGLTETDVSAEVTDGQMDGSLLGMSYLSRFSHIEMGRNRLVLTR
jgi:aspartyl protease family protein